MTNNIWNSKTIIITGHIGFKGTWLILYSNLYCAKIIGIFKDITSNPSLFKILNLKKKIVDVKLDLRDLKKLIKIFKKYQLNLLFHLAAQSLVKKSYIYTIAATKFIFNNIENIQRRWQEIIINKNFINFKKSLFPVNKNFSKEIIKEFKELNLI